MADLFDQIAFASDQATRRRRWNSGRSVWPGRRSRCASSSVSAQPASLGVSERTERRYLLLVALNFEHDLHDHYFAHYLQIS